MFTRENELTGTQKGVLENLGTTSQTDVLKALGQIMKVECKIATLSKYWTPRCLLFRGPFS